jgi:hypothetical protein
MFTLFFQFHSNRFVRSIDQVFFIKTVKLFIKFEKLFVLYYFSQSWLKVYLKFVLFRMRFVKLLQVILSVLFSFQELCLLRLRFWHNLFHNYNKFSHLFSISLKEHYSHNKIVQALSILELVSHQVSLKYY